MKTPYYYINESALDTDVNMLLNALDQNYGNTIHSYSVKTNSLPWLLTYMKQHGFYAEIVSDTEYDLAKRLGFPDEHMIYNGPIKNREVFDAILTAGGLVNMDSHEEPEWFADLCSRNPDKEMSVGVRVNCDIAALCPTEVLADEEGSRFGYCYETGELEKVIRFIEAIPNAHVAGLHLHSSTKSRGPAVYKALAEMAVRIGDEYQITPDYIDMGGGYFGGRIDMPDYRDYIPAIAGALKKKYDPSVTKLIVEPGVSLISRASSFVTTVKDIKHEREHTYVIIDGSRLNLNPQITRRQYPHHNLYVSKEERPTVPSQMITGFTCMEYDRLFEEKDAPELRVGDRVVFDTAGGYTMCLNPLFIHYLPAVYAGLTDGSIFTAREPWTNDEYLAKNHW